MYVCVCPCAQDKTLHGERIWHTILFEKVFCAKDPLLPAIPDEFKAARSLTAPFKVAKRKL